MCTGARFGRTSAGLKGPAENGPGGPTGKGWGCAEERDLPRERQALSRGLGRVGSFIPHMPMGAVLGAACAEGNKHAGLCPRGAGALVPLGTANGKFIAVNWDRGASRGTVCDGPLTAPSVP